MTTRRYTAGETANFIWTPPAADGYASAANVVVAFASGDVTASLSARAADTITAISSDRRRITIETDDGTPGLDGLVPVPAFVEDGLGAQVPVRVLRAVSETAPGGVGDPYTVVVELSEPLPHDVSMLGSLRWQVWSASVAMPSTKQGPVRWRVSWSGTIGGQAAPDTMVDDGVLYVVRAPFSTGLDSQTLIASSPVLLSRMPAGQSSWAPQIALALDTLVTRINARLLDGKSVNDLTGGQFRNAHAMETRLFVLQGLAEAGLGRADAMDAVERALTQELDRIFGAGVAWLDADGDGVVDDGETNTQPGRVTLRSHVGNSALMDTSLADAEPRGAYSRARVEAWGER